jgi:hypothetical protein
MRYLIACQEHNLTWIRQRKYFSDSLLDLTKVVAGFHVQKHGLILSLQSNIHRHLSDYNETNTIVSEQFSPCGWLFTSDTKQCVVSDSVCLFFAHLIMLIENLFI